MLLDQRNLTEVYDVFLIPRGVEAFLIEYNRSANATHSVIRMQTARFADGPGESVLDVAIQWVEEDSSRIRSYANGANTMSGGSHLLGFREGVLRAVRHYGRLRGIAEIAMLTDDDIRVGLTAIVAVRLPEPAFVTFYKEYLTNPEVRPWVQREVNKQLFAYLSSHPTEAKLILDRIMRSRRHHSQ